jgi:hypothetical protein
MVSDAEAAEWLHDSAGCDVECDRIERLLADRERMLAALEDMHPLSLYREKEGTPGECLACDVQEEVHRA